MVPMGPQALRGGEKAFTTLSCCLAPQTTWSFTGRIFRAPQKRAAGVHAAVVYCFPVCKREVAAATLHRLHKRLFTVIPALFLVGGEHATSFVRITPAPLATLSRALIVIPVPVVLIGLHAVAPLHSHNARSSHCPELLGIRLSSIKLLVLCVETLHNVLHSRLCVSGDGPGDPLFWVIISRRKIWVAVGFPFGLLPSKLTHSVSY
mmetsp:Transcript_1362/g.2273  ORF Transcript_1362/g.2273 Transcript_1362/m.2273 type:complete len:206 (-) Transcript_1362:13-630(-)